MRIVFDTNVLIAAFLTRGTSAEAFEHCLAEHELYTSAYILKEYEKTLRSKKFHFPANLVDASLAFLRNEMTVTPVQDLSARASRDRNDDAILSTAIAARARCIVSGDKDLLVLSSFRDVVILKPSHFWEWEKRHM